MIWSEKLCDAERYTKRVGGADEKHRILLGILII